MIARSGTRTLASGALLLAIAILASPLVGAQTFDLVIVNGRVLDPESSLDGVRNIGITAGRLPRSPQSDLTGRTTIDATGAIVVSRVHRSARARPGRRKPISFVRRWRDDSARARGRRR